MQYLLGQAFVLSLNNDAPKVAIISSVTDKGMPKAKFINEDGDLEEALTIEKERSPLREECSEKVSPSCHRIYYGKLTKKNVKLAENMRLKVSDDDIKLVLKEANEVYKSMNKKK